MVSHLLPRLLHRIRMENLDWNDLFVDSKTADGKSDIATEGMGAEGF